jgi:CO dehydrogenase nickel-insertion accessory protein CooC1
VFVLNRIRDDEMEHCLQQKLGEKGIKPIGIIHEDASISTAWLTGAALDASRAQAEAGKIVEALEGLDGS